MTDRVRCYGRRLLSPFHGVIQVITIDHGVAESTDGINWVLYVHHEDIVSHTGMSEIRYGSWNAREGLRLSMVRGTGSSSMIDQVGERLLGAVIENAGNIPFALADCFECWSVNEDGELLALIESGIDHDDCRSIEAATWHPGATSFDEFESEAGDAHQLMRVINHSASKLHKTLWVRREAGMNGFNGDGVCDDGRRISADAFPKRLLREAWSDDNIAQLVSDYLGWQAPWILQLDSLDDSLRAQVEAQAWLRPVLCAQQFNLFNRVLDEKQLKVVRVQARLMGFDSQSQRVVESFIQTGDKETYSP